MEIKVNSELKYLVDSIDGKESIPDEEVYVQDNQPEDGKIWIDTGEISNLGTEVVDSLEGTQANKAPSVRAVVQDLVSILYPVGSIYMSTNATNPKVLFGIGEWEQIKDTFLMSAGTTYGAGTTGGAATHTHSTGNHTLTEGEMPQHRHLMAGTFAKSEHVDKGGNWNQQIQRYLMAGHNLTNTATGTDSTSSRIYAADLQDRPLTDYTGGGGAHNHGDTGSTSNLPPYLAVYTWKRIS